MDFRCSKLCDVVECGKHWIGGRRGRRVFTWLLHSLVKDEEKVQTKKKHRMLEKNQFSHFTLRCVFFSVVSSVQSRLFHGKWIWMSSKLRRGFVWQKKKSLNFQSKKKFRSLKLKAKILSNSSSAASGTSKSNQEIVFMLWRFPSRRVWHWRQD